MKLVLITIPRASADGSDMNTTSVSTMAILIAKSGSQFAMCSSICSAVYCVGESLTLGTAVEACAVDFDADGAGRTFEVVKNA
jgi:hypothetical protein